MTNHTQRNDISFLAALDRKMPKRTPNLRSWRVDLPDSDQYNPSKPLPIRVRELNDVWMELRRKEESGNFAPWFALPINVLLFTIISNWVWLSLTFSDFAKDGDILKLVYSSIGIITVTTYLTMALTSLSTRAVATLPRYFPVRFNRARQKVYVYQHDVNSISAFFKPWKPWPKYYKVFDWQDIHAEIHQKAPPIRGQARRGQRFALICVVCRPGTNEVIDRFELDWVYVWYLEALPELWSYCCAYMRGEAVTDVERPDAGGAQLEHTINAWEYKPLLRWPAELDLESRTAPLTERGRASLGVDNLALNTQLTPAIENWAEDLPVPNAYRQFEAKQQAEPKQFALNHINDTWMEIPLYRTHLGYGDRIWGKVPFACCSILALPILCFYVYAFFYKLVINVPMHVEHHLFFLGILSVLAYPLSITYRVIFRMPRDQPIRFNRARQKVYVFNYKRSWNPWGRWKKTIKVYDWASLRGQIRYETNQDNSNYQLCAAVCEADGRTVKERFIIALNNRENLRQIWHHCCNYMAGMEVDAEPKAPERPDDWAPRKADKWPDDMQKESTTAP